MISFSAFAPVRYSPVRYVPASRWKGRRLNIRKVKTRGSALTAILGSILLLAPGTSLCQPQTVAAVVTPVVVDTANPVPVDTATPKVQRAAAPPAVDINFGSMTLGGLLQAWYTDGSGNADNSFRLRRAELKLTGKINSSVSWSFMIDAAKALSVNSSYVTIDGKKVLAEQSVSQGSRMLQDAFVTMSGKHGVRFSIGQFKIPFSNEGTGQTAKVPTVEQPMFVSDRARGAFANVRDLGAMIQQTPVKRVDYSLGLFNGSGDTQNGVDQNDQKALVGRFVVRPWKPALQIGASAVVGGKPSADRARRDRSGAEVQYAGKSLTVRSELVRATDGNTNRVGSYVFAGYKVRPAYEAVFRFDLWDPNTALESTSASATAREWLVGVTNSLAGSNAKIQLNVTHRRYAARLLPNLSMVLVNVQTAW